MLGGYLGPAAKLLERGGRHRVGGIPGRMLHHHAAVEHRGLVGVRQLRMVGVTGMTVVTGQQEAVGHQPPIVAVRKSQSVHDGLKGFRQEGRSRALLGLGADLLVVKYAQHRDGGGLPGSQEALGAGKYTGQVVQPGCGQEFSRRPPHGARLVVVQEQIPGHDVLRLASGGSGDLPVKAALLLSAGIQRHQILSGIVLGAIIAVPVQMDGHTRDQCHVLFQIHQTCLQTVVPAHQYPSGSAEGAVQPAVVDHAAVALGGKAHKLTGQFCMVPQPEAGRIRVTGRQHKPGWGTLGHPKCQQRRAVLGDKILAAGGQAPLPCRQLGIPLPPQPLAEIFHRVEAVGAFLDVLQHG